jgi:hypothetical protein
MYSFKVSKMKNVETVAHSAYDIWAAAVYAQRINKGYYKEDQFNADGVCTREANRTLARNALALGGKITVEDRCKGAEARKFISSRLMVTAITKKLNDFQQSLSRAVAMDEFIVPQDRMSIGIVNSQIAMYEKAMKEEELTKDSVYGTFGKINERLEIKVKPVARFWLTDWGTFRYNSITTDGYKTSFYYKEKLEIGDTVEVRGTVKKHTNETTTINRVKVLK